MKLTTIKATLLRYCDMSLSALTELKSLIKHNVLLDVDMESLSNPSLRIAQATNAAGATVCYCSVATAYVVGALAFNPRSTEAETREAGNTIENEIVLQAQRDGVSSILMVLPDNLPSEPGEKFIRVVERKIPNVVNTHGIGCSATSQATQYVN